jgi:dCTP deaminase
MTVLCDTDIAAAIRAYDLIELFDDLETQLQPASFDVRVTDLRTIYGDPIEAVNGMWLLGSLSFALASTIELFNVPSHLTARLDGKSTTARRALQIHAAGNIDPGFRGTITLELFNQGSRPVAIEHGGVIGQVSFHKLSACCARPYGAERGSHYQDQRVTTAAHTVRAIAEKA